MRRTTRELLDDAAEAQGWTLATEITVLCDFIDSGWSTSAFDDWLTKRVLDEADDFQVDPHIAAIGVYSWESQAAQYPEKGPAGISYFAGETPIGTVDCLLFRRKNGDLVGILNHYPIDFPPLEVAGNVNVWVHPDFRRQGVGTRLVREALNRYDITLEGQRFSAEGVALARYLRKEGFA